jgi:hypothetical protein
MPKPNLNFIRGLGGTIIIVLGLTRLNVLMLNIIGFILFPILKDLRLITPHKSFLKNNCGGLYTLSQRSQSIPIAMYNINKKIFSWIFFGGQSFQLSSSSRPIHSRRHSTFSSEPKPLRKKPTKSLKLFLTN